MRLDFCIHGKFSHMRGSKRKGCDRDVELQQSAESEAPPRKPSLTD